LQVLSARVAARRRNFEIYQSTLGNVPEIEFMPEANFGDSTRWLTALTIAPEAFGADREYIRLQLTQQQIQGITYS
jgi:pyridoxal phosphate-dependent aminotransferase EpsN